MFSTDIPIPTSRASKYPFADLKAGQSVLFVCTLKEKANARKAAYRIGQYYHWKYVVRSLKEGVRMWRLE